MVALIRILKANPATRLVLEGLTPGPLEKTVPKPSVTAEHPSSTRRRVKRTVRAETQGKVDSLTLVVAYANGRTQEEIAKEYRLYIQTVRKRLHEAGIVTRLHATILSHEDLQLARSLLGQGKSARNVAQQLGVAHKHAGGSRALQLPAR